MRALGKYGGGLHGFPPIDAFSVCAELVGTITSPLVQCGLWLKVTATFFYTAPYDRAGI